MNKILLAAALAASSLCGAALQSDIEYGTAAGVSLKMDAWVPDGAGPFPTVILVHGGGWTAGDKETFFKPFFEPLTKAGFAWFTINYRLAPQYRYPAAVDDVVAAIKFVEAHASEYKVDRKRLALSGESAGGHLVALVGARYGRQLHLAAVVPFYPPTDFDAMLEGADQTPNAVTAVEKFLGVTELNGDARKLMREASPVTYVKKNMPPFLFVHGTGDKTVSFHQSVEMCDRMKQAGARCEVYPVEGAPHGVGPWEKNPAWQGYKEKVPQWLRETMR